MTNAPPPVSSWLLAAALSLPWLTTRAAVLDAVFYNQLAALAAWGAWLAWAGLRPRLRPVAAPLVALLLCAGWAAAGIGMQGGTVFVLLAAAAVLMGAAGAADDTRTEPVAWGLYAAGLGSTLVALVQFLTPGLADGTLVAVGTSVGRAVGNMRQPNHLATALLCSIVMTVWLWQTGRLRGAWAGASIVGMNVALAASASRGGALALAVLLIWAAVDRRLPRQARVMLCATPFMYGLAWALLAAYADARGVHFYGSDRLTADADISSSRFAIYRDALVLIGQQPWTGVGWGRFNAAWTFTVLPQRPVAFFDHTHNLLLQLAVEMGMPAALLVLALVLVGMWRARAAWRHGDADAASPARAALALLGVLGLHSMVEYPLWYAYFLLPAAWALGLWHGTAAADTAAQTHQAWRTPALLTSAAMVAGVLWSAVDHRRVEAIFATPARAQPLAVRIADGSRSALFGQHADYAAVTAAPADTTLARFRRPLQQLIDTRLLIAYIEALRANGRSAEALYAAQRLREFRRPDAQAYFKDCALDELQRPWQCSTAPVPLRWTDLLP